MIFSFAKSNNFKERRISFKQSNSRPFAAVEHMEMWGHWAESLYKPKTKHSRHKAAASA